MTGLLSRVRGLLPRRAMASSAAANGAAAGAAAAPAAAYTLEALPWDPTFTRELPADPSTENRPRQVQGALFSWVAPTPAAGAPRLVAASPEVAALIGLAPGELDRPEFALAMAGAAPLRGARPYAQCYGGHQFGSWAGQLGDGRAICLGEVAAPAAGGAPGAPGAAGGRWELQLKGAGPTPYSRRADGRAVLRSSVREYVASEAMAALGVPTTRALALAATGAAVVRDMFYSGDARPEPGAVVCRVARSFVRFGSFQLPASREGQAPLARALADHVIRHHYPEFAPAGAAAAASAGDFDAAAYDADAAPPAPADQARYAGWLSAVAARTGRLVAAWHRVGFTHGVLNTDNMSILGDTIDYGPYAWLERFDPAFTPNTTDLPGRRYAFRQQPEIGQYNVMELARAVLSAGLVTQEQAGAAIELYGETLTAEYNGAVARKLGLRAYDLELATGLMKLMYADSADYTNTFRALSSVASTPSSGDDAEAPPALQAAIEWERLGAESRAAWGGWLRRYRAALRAEGRPAAERVAEQDATNPAIVPRNHVLVRIIEAAERGEYAPLHAYLEALRRPYSGEGLEAKWVEPAPAEPRLGVELLSCSS